MTTEIISIKAHALTDPDSFYTQRWECGYMVYHGGVNWFSTSITKAKEKLVEIRKAVAFKFLISETYRIVHGDCLHEKKEYARFPKCWESALSDESRVYFEQIYPKDPSAYEYAKRRAKNFRFEGFKVAWLRPDIDPYFAKCLADMASAQRKVVYLPQSML
jgi:hypothetical protein